MPDGSHGHPVDFNDVERESSFKITALEYIDGSLGVREPRNHKEGQKS